MKQKFVLPEERTLYLTELEQLESSLRTLRQRVGAGRRAIKAVKGIHLAHVHAAQSVNATLVALVEVWQPEYQNKLTLHESL